MPDTYEYKVRDKSGNMVTGTLEADSELLVLQRLREMGYTPLEVGQGEAGPEPRDQPQDGRRSSSRTWRCSRGSSPR